MPRDIVCLRNISINTLHKGEDGDDDNNNDSNNNDNNNNNNNNNNIDTFLVSNALKAKRYVCLFICLSQEYKYKYHE